MLLSIIAPVYNVEKYIRECLDSIINQEFVDYELILVDDGSTDKSGKICDEYAEKHHYIKVIHKQNEGLLLARRTGLKVAQGDYCMHCDSDDYYAPETLKEVAKVIEQNQPDMVMFGYNVVDDEHEIVEEHYDVFPDGTIIDQKNREELLLKLSTTTWLNNMVTKVTKRELVDIDADYSTYRDIKMGEDLFQVIPLVRNCASFVYMAKPFYFYRYNPKGMSKNIDRSYLENHITVSERLYTLLLDEKISEETLIGFYNRYVKDIYKYLLRFAKADIGKTEFEKLYREASDNIIYRDALQRFNAWSRANTALFNIIKPEYYGIDKFLSRTILSKKV